MKKTFSAFLLSTLFSTTLFAQWEMVGNADYNWGPFQIYTLSLYTETGSYQENQRPLIFLSILISLWKEKVLPSV